MSHEPPDGGTVVRMPSSLRPSRSGVLLFASVVVMAAASIATHLAGAGGAPGEAAEHAEHVVVPTVVGPLGALALLGAIWLLRGRALRPAWFLVLPPAAFAMQELAERLTQGPETEPSLLATALTQLAFALLAFLLAHAILGAVRRVVRFLAVASRRTRRPVPAPAWPTTFASVAKLPAPPGAHLGRAPPYLG
jgi:hypothetical protein